jgi:predicted hydrocarbon binding protein
MPRKRKPKEEKKEELKPLKVSEMLLVTLANLEVKAWAYLGLVSHPENKKISKDLGEAKLAIDAIDSLFNLMKERMGEDEKKHFELTLANLKLNYVKES